MRQSPWMKIIGADYVERAFQFAHDADPVAELYYNDNSLESEAKRKGAVALHKKGIQRVTFWGVTDADSWRNNWPVRGRTDYPLLFDRNGASKPAFEAVIRTAQAK